MAFVKAASTEAGALIRMSAFSLEWANELNALTRASTKEPAAPGPCCDTGRPRCAEEGQVSFSGISCTLRWHQSNSAAAKPCLPVLTCTHLDFP